MNCRTTSCWPNALISCFTQRYAQHVHFQTPDILKVLWPLRQNSIKCIQVARFDEIFWNTLKRVSDGRPATFLLRLPVYYKNCCYQASSNLALFKPVVYSPVVYLNREAVVNSPVVYLNKETFVNSPVVCSPRVRSPFLSTTDGRPSTDAQSDDWMPRNGTDDGGGAVALGLVLCACWCNPTDVLLLNLVSFASVGELYAGQMQVYRNY